MNDIQESHIMPSLDGISEYISNELFDQFVQILKERYKVKEKIEFSKCSMQPGWNVKFKKSNKSLCVIYPQQRYFTVMVVVGLKEKEDVEVYLLKASSILRDIYDKTQEGRGQRWLMIDLEDEGHLYEDVLKLIDIKMKKR